MATGGSAPPGSDSLSPAALARRSRFFGQQYADVTKLREMGAKHDHKAARLHQRISRINTRIEKLRHQATVLREKEAKVLATLPELEQEVKQRMRDIERLKSGGSLGMLASDVTAQQYRLRKTQQKSEDVKQRGRALELRAAQRTQKAQELKVKVDQLLEQAGLAEEEGGQFKQRADRLQQVIDQESAAPAAASPTAPPPPPPATP